MTPDRYPNKRSRHRGPGGKFRRATLADVGFAECETCGAIFRPDFSKLEDDPFPDPRAMRDARRLCAGCANPEPPEVSP